MSDAKHTPGPWAAAGASYIIRITAAGERAPVAEVAMPMGRSGPECSSNARLIAAAPDLLEALKACRQLIDEALPKFDWGRSSLDGDAIRLLNETPGIVRAAIAKAEDRA